MSVLIITNGVKQWACVIDYLLQNRDEVHTVLDFRNINTLMPKSIRMKKIENGIDHVSFVKFKKRFFLIIKF